MLTQINKKKCYAALQHNIWGLSIYLFMEGIVSYIVLLLIIIVLI